MTDAELDAIEARANAASDGPWRLKADEQKSEWTTAVAHDCKGVGVVFADLDGRLLGSYEADNVFIAAARTDIPLLISEIRSLQKWADEVDGYRIEHFNDLEKEQAEHAKTSEELLTTRAELQVARERLKAVESTVDSWFDEAVQSPDDASSPAIGAFVWDLRKVMRGAR